MKYYDLYSYGTTYRVTPYRAKYAQNNTLAVELITDEGEPFASLTVNIADSDKLASDRLAFVDTNNCPWAEEFLIFNDLARPTKRYGRSGYCYYPLYEFTIEKLTPYSDEP